MEFNPGNFRAEPISRRGFGRRVLAASAIGSIPAARTVLTPVARWFEALDDVGKERLCLPFDHPSRTQIHENWAVVEPTIGTLPDLPRALCREVLLGLGDPAWRDRLFRVIDEDSGGLETYHVALFGRPDRPGPCELVLTGRHLTIRADGHRPGAFSRRGPFFLGHASETDNVWRYPDDRARRLFRSLDQAQRPRAFSEYGIGFDDLNPTQAGRFRDLLASLGPIVESDRAGPGSRLQCHRGDSGDGFGSIWKIQGRGTSWSFHGVPHVHVRLEFDGSDQPRAETTS